MSILSSKIFERGRKPGSHVAVGGFALAKARLAQFASDRGGDVAIMFGLMAIAMFLMVGGAVDIGRWLHARNDTIAAIDAAVLAGGRALQLNGDEAAAIAAAERFYNENKKGRLPLNSDNIQFVMGDGGLSFTAEGSAYIATPFLSLANIEELPLLNLSGSEFSKAELAVGGNSKTNIEISMMLDVSGSMDDNNKFEDMQEAAKDLINIVVWDDQSEYTSKVAIAPFSADVRLDASLLASSRNPAEQAFVEGPQYCTTKSRVTTCKKDKFYRNNCVVERKGANKYAGVGPGADKYVMSHYVKERQVAAGCSTPAVSSVMPLSNNKAALINKINGMQMGGGTAGHLGTAWAWYMLSPDWNTVLPAASQPKPYNTLNLLKIAILMTDGEYNTQYSTYGIRSGTSNAPTPTGQVNGSSNTQARALCDGMKLAGVTVYTVGFDLGGNNTAIQTLTYCATSAGHAYQADDGHQLKQAFRDIALKISALYLSN